MITPTFEDVLGGSLSKVSAFGYGSEIDCTSGSALAPPGRLAVEFLAPTFEKTKQLLYRASVKTLNSPAVWLITGLPIGGTRNIYWGETSKIVIDVGYDVSVRPFLERDLVRERTLQDLIERIRKSDSIVVRERIAARLEFLVSESECEADDLPMSVESLEHFTSFLEANPDVQLPSIAMDWKGQISAEWRQSASSKCNLQFLVDGKVLGLIVVPNSDRPGDVSRHTFHAATENAHQIIERNGASSLLFS